MNYKLISNIKDNIINTIFLNRGFQLEEIDHYLKVSKDDLINPATIKNMQEGAEMLIKHIAANDKIFIQVDADCDGYTSAAALINYLNFLFPHFVQTNISYRLHDDKTHGILLNTIPKDVKLVIIPDAGSNQINEHKVLYEAGIDVLIIDHHEAEVESPYACIINNHMCDYPTKTLSGAGMVYKFCSYIDQLLDKHFAEFIMDLAGLGIDADVMQLNDYETHYIVDEGFKNVRNPLFYSLVQANSYGMKNVINPTSVAFYVAPYINAMTRSGSLEEKIATFEAMLEYKAMLQVPSTKRGEKGKTELQVQQAIRYMNNVKSRQKKACDKCQELIEEMIEEDKSLLQNKILIIRLPKEIEVEGSLRGLIANKLMSEYSHPTLVLTETDKGWEGSARNYDKLADFQNFKDFIKTCPGVLYAEGHQGAFGCCIEKDKVNDFIQYSNEQLKDYEFSPCYGVDFIFDNYNIDAYDITTIGNLKNIWGKGIDEPLIAIENIFVKKDDVAILSPGEHPTIKIKTPKYEILKFRANEKEVQDLTTHATFTINVVGKCDVNLWGGGCTPQVLIEDYELVNYCDYVF